MLPFEASGVSLLEACSLTTGSWCSSGSSGVAVGLEFGELYPFAAAVVSYEARYMLPCVLLLISLPPSSFVLTLSLLTLPSLPASLPSPALAPHQGDPADSRMRAAAKRRGIALASISRRITPQDFERFDYILAMDRSNLCRCTWEASYLAGPVGGAVWAKGCRQPSL